jgi:hypothetical protein
MLDHCKAVASRAGLDPAKFDLKTSRSTYASRTLRTGFDVRTVKTEWVAKSLETTMRYLVPSQQIHARFDQGTVRVSTITRLGRERLPQEKFRLSVCRRLQDWLAAA